MDRRQKGIEEGTNGQKGEMNLRGRDKWTEGRTLIEGQGTKLKN